MLSPRAIGIIKGCIVMEQTNEYEPMIAIYGEFGVRLEDWMHITDSGARMFTEQSPSIDQPFV